MRLLLEFASEEFSEEIDDYWNVDYYSDAVNPDTIIDYVAHARAQSVAQSKYGKRGTPLPYREHTCNRDYPQGDFYPIVQVSRIAT